MNGSSATRSARISRIERGNPRTHHDRQQPNRGRAVRAPRSPDSRVTESAPASTRSPPRGDAAVLAERAKRFGEFAETAHRLIVAPVPRDPRRPESDPGGRIPFWAHQLAELLLGVVLLFEGARNEANPAVMIAGGALMFFTLVTNGPLAAWPRLPRPMHRVGDFVFAAVLAVSPLLVGVDDVAAIVLLEAAAVVMLWLALRSEFRVKGKRSKPPATPPAPPGQPPDTPAMNPPVVRA